MTTKIPEGVQLIEGKEVFSLRMSNSNSKSDDI